MYNPPAAETLPVLFADEHILVLDKPSGLLTVPGRPAEHADCLESRAREAFPEARIVHRLDMDTSGVIVLALTAHAHRHIGLQFEKRQTRKEYQALVWGEVNDDVGRIDQPIITDWPNRPRQMVDHERGRSAVTDWLVLAREGGMTRVSLKPLTGRSHQLRVHMDYLGHPILGDNLYAHDQAFQARGRLCLHAKELGFRHPDGGEEMCFSSSVPF
ncbi:RluA family pseudouridine synthase [Maricaulis sp.]|uniref:RluA family pseudouridine synthase n=1 Tax=Maricaulis sp. TaxID=1486257 RepID=UPI0025C5011B|nr:RluA family pseudouridine synthase [Maricaulis sp.]